MKCPLYVIHIYECYSPIMIVVISGIPGSGAVNITNKLSTLINAIIIPQNAFYEEIPDEFNVGGPSTINWKGLCETIVKINMVGGPPMIVVGHCLLSCGILMELADVVVFVDAPKHIAKRNFVNSHAENYTDEQLTKKDKYFDEELWPSFEKYVDTYVRGFPPDLGDKFITVEAQVENGTKQIIDFLTGSEGGDGFDQGGESEGGSLYI